ncbi:hypothetical protein [Rheinheimera aquimaris]|uniref:hypothetical protein n=1 Tax=Rheinheimera aquimaris TaxID=412437 RepID=UPI00106472D8|nr:hypothetical protein [Rheinheimera aquimaris]
MHLDLTHMLPAQVATDIANIAEHYGQYCSNMLWPLWLRHIDINVTSINVLQAAAQILSSYNCVTATLRFGLYCSKYYPQHGNVISNDVALHYLRIAFQMLMQSEQQKGLLTWLQDAEGYEYDKSQKQLFWVHACAAYAHHEYDANPNNLSAEVEFAFHFLLNERMK